MTLAEVARFCLQKKSAKDRRDHLLLRAAFRPASMIPTWMFYRLGIRPNQATALSFIVGVGGLATIGIGGGQRRLLGAGLIMLWFVLDNVDGNLAVLRGESSRLGAYFDAVNGYVMQILLLPVVGIALATTSVTGSVVPPHMWAWVGSAGGLFQGLGLLVRGAAADKAGHMQEGEGSAQLTSFSSIEVVGKNLKGFGTVSLVLVVTAAIGRLDVFLLAYVTISFAFLLVAFLLGARALGAGSQGTAGR